MSVRPVLSIPHSTLSTPSLPIEVIGELERQLARDLVDTMRASPACVGLAAPQIGAGLKAFAMDVSSHKKARTNHGLVVLFNPEIVWQEDPITAREGCMSVPDLTGDVSRPNRVLVQGIDLDSNQVSIEAEGFEARALFHEIDHLEGKVFLDRVAGSHSLFKRKVYK